MRRRTTHSSTARRRFYILVAIAVAIVLFPVWLSLRTFVVKNGPARLYFSTPYTQVQLNEVFTVDLRVSTSGHSINAVQSTIKVDPQRLQIVNMTTAQSFCALYTENSFDANRGEADIACGTPHPGFAGDSLVVSLSLRAKMAGDATITVDRSTAQVLADDGKGTDLLGTIPSYVISVKQASY